MKSILAVAGVVALTGCAVQQPYYTTAQVQDPYQWRTVSVTPSDRAPGSPATTVYTTEPLPAPSSRVVYAEPVTTTTYITQPQTVYYAPAPVYYSPAPAYYYPPVSIGLDFVFSNRSWGGYRGGYGRGWGRGGYRR